MKIKDIVCEAGKYAITVEILYWLKQPMCTVIVKAYEKIDDYKEKTICCLDRLVGMLPIWVYVDRDQCQWEVRAEQIPVLIAWLGSLNEDVMVGWLDENQKEEAWHE